MYCVISQSRSCVFSTACHHQVSRQFLANKAHQAGTRTIYTLIAKVEVSCQACARLPCMSGAARSDIRSRKFHSPRTNAIARSVITSLPLLITTNDCSCGIWLLTWVWGTLRRPASDEEYIVIAKEESGIPSVWWSEPGYFYVGAAHKQTKQCGCTKVIVSDIHFVYACLLCLVMYMYVWCMLAIVLQSTLE